MILGLTQYHNTDSNLMRQELLSLQDEQHNLFPFNDLIISTLLLKSPSINSISFNICLTFFFEVFSLSNTVTP